MPRDADYDRPRIPEAKGSSHFDPISKSVEDIKKQLDEISRERKEFIETFLEEFRSAARWTTVLLFIIAVLLMLQLIGGR